MGTGLKRIFPAMAVASLVTALMAVTMGGVVRVTGSGLGCPDWPLCYGKVIPPWELTSWLEYMHRLSAAVAGGFTFLMVISAFSRYGARDTTIRLVLLSAVLIVIQAGFGCIHGPLGAEPRRGPDTYRHRYEPCGSAGGRSCQDRRSNDSAVGRGGLG